MKNNKRFFINISLVALAICVGYIDITNAAARVAVRGAPVASTTRRSVSTAVSTVAKAIEKVEPESAVEPELIITNKSSEFDAAITSVMESADDDNSFAEEIRRQRAALAASEATTIANAAQRGAMVTNSNTCDIALRKCMQTKCGNDFTKCATDGDTTFGDKLNACRRDTTCTGEEFRLFTTEIKADRDMNVRVSSYNDIINCGNQYNACIVNECGTTYNKCLGKANADAAIQKCATIAKECTESDSGLASRFGTAIGKLRESAEIEVKADEERMYALRDSMRKACESMGAMFDERTFDCIYTINFFAGENQQTPTASRKRYAGDTFICMQEWFGVNATTFKENAFRETRAQSEASSAMLGAGVGSAVGMVTSGAINRAIDTQKAKKELKKECRKDLGLVLNEDGECVSVGKAARKMKEDLKQTQQEAHKQLQTAGKNIKEDIHLANELLQETNETANQVRQGVKTSESMLTDATGTVTEVVSQVGGAVGDLGEGVQEVVKNVDNLVEDAADVAGAIYTQGASAEASVEKNKFKYQAQANAGGDGKAPTNTLNNIMKVIGE